MQCHIRRGTGYEKMARKNSKSQSQADGIRIQKKVTHTCIYTSLSFYIFSNSEVSSPEKDMTKKKFSNLPNLSTYTGLDIPLGFHPHQVLNFILKIFISLRHS